MLIAGCAAPGHLPADALSGPAPPPDSEPVAAGAPLAGLAELPRPAALAPRRTAATGPQYQLPGAAIDLALLPRRAYISEGTALRLYPLTYHEDPPGHNVPDEFCLAYALYRFNLTGFGGEPEINLDWDSTYGGPGVLFIGIADYPAQRWRFFQLADPRRLRLTAAQLAAGTDPQTGDFPLVLAATTDDAVVRTLQVGAVPVSPIQLSGVNFTELRPFERRLLVAAYTGGEPVDWYWEGGPVNGPRFGKTVEVDNSQPATAKVFPMRVTAVDASGGRSSLQFDLTEPTAADEPPQIGGVLHAGGVTGSTYIAGTSENTNFDFFNALWSWDYRGGATPATGSGIISQTKLGAPGVYPARLIIVQPSGVATFNYQLTVVAAGAEPPPNLTAVRQGTHQSPALAGYPCRFEADYGDGEATDWQWAFGTAATPPASSAEIAEAAFSGAGEYDCQVTAANAAGQSSKAFKVIVLAPIRPYITGVDWELYFDHTYENTPTTFSCSVLGADSVAWDFGGGAAPNTSSDLAPQVTLGPAGHYLGRLVATNAHGSTRYFFRLDTASIAAPVIDSVTPQTCRAGTKTYFSAHTSGGSIVSMSWNFGGGCQPNTPVYQGGNGGGEHTELAYATPQAPGIYNCSVIAGNPSGTEQFDFTLTVTP